MIQNIEIKEIDESEFNKNYSVVGNLDGNYQDVINFLRWTIESRNTDNGEHLKQVIQVLSNRFGKEITTKFLKGILSNPKNANQRITYLMKKIGLRYSKINRYYSEMVNSVSHKNKIIYKLINNSYVVTKEIPMTVGNFHQTYKKETLKKIITLEEFEKKQARLAEMIKEAQQIKEVIKPSGTTDIQEEVRYIETNCPKCKKVIKIPLTPNIDTDKYEMLAYCIYNAVLKDVKNGIYLCENCRKEISNGFSNGWMEEQIIDFMKKQSGAFQFNSKEFCEEFRIDKRNVTIGYVKNKISELCPTIQVKQEENKIKVRIC
jgi:hypothetical protein